MKEERLTSKLLKVYKLSDKWSDEQADPDLIK